MNLKNYCYVYKLKTENKILNNCEGMVFQVWLNIIITQLNVAHYFMFYKHFLMHSANKSYYPQKEDSE